MSGKLTVDGIFIMVVTANFMQSGSLTIGGINADYGTATDWTGNTAGLMMECSNYTEICVHDANTRVVSLMYYDGVYNKYILVGIKDGVKLKHK